MYVCMCVLESARLDISPPICMCVCVYVCMFECLGLLDKIFLNLIDECVCVCFDVCVCVFVCVYLGLLD